MSKLFIVRHCESEANVQDILASQMDYPLSLKGKNDAKEIAKNLRSIATPDIIMSSPLIRAQQTAQAFADEFDITEILTDERILEQHLGRYSGMSYKQVEKEPDYEHEKEKRWNWIPEGGGESYAQISKRLKTFFNTRPEFKEDKNILIVSHAVTMRLIKMILDGTDPKYPTTLAKNGEIWQYDFSGKL